MSEQVALPIPCCPHCHAEMPSLGSFNWQMGPWLIISVFCLNPECHIALHFSAIPVGLGEPDRPSLLS